MNNALISHSLFDQWFIFCPLHFLCAESIMFLYLAPVDRCHRCGRVVKDYRGLCYAQPVICTVCLDTLLVRRIVWCMQQWGLGHRVTIPASIIMLVLEWFPSYLYKHRMTYGRLLLEGGPYTYSPFFAIDLEYTRVRYAAPLRRSGRSYWPGYRHLTDNESLTTHVLSFISPGATVAAQMRRGECRGAQMSSEAWCAQCILRQCLD